MIQKYYGPVHYYGNTEFNGVVTAKDEVEIKKGNTTYGVYDRLSEYDKLYYTDVAPVLEVNKDLYKYTGTITTDVEEYFSKDNNCFFVIDKVKVEGTNNVTGFTLDYTINNYGYYGNNYTYSLELKELTSSKVSEYPCYIKYSYPTIYKQEESKFYFPEDVLYSCDAQDRYAICDVKVTFSNIRPVVNNEYACYIKFEVSVQLVPSEPPLDFNSNFFHEKVNTNSYPFYFKNIYENKTLNISNDNQRLINKKIDPTVVGGYNRFDNCTMKSGTPIKLFGPL